MKWLTTNLYPLLLFVIFVGSPLILFSFVRVRLRLVRLNWTMLLSGLVPLVLLLIGGLCVIYVQDDGNDMVDEIVKPKPIPNLSTSLQRLQSSWDSELTADWPVAETLASISEIAYLPPVDAGPKYHSLGFDKFIPIVSGSMIGYVISGNDVTVIAFRGTDPEETSDWLANLGRSAYETPHGSIHKGFHDAYESLKPQIMTILQTRENEHIWITGHSLGGALALVCAYDLLDSESVPIDGLITFGQPMIARKELADHLDNVLFSKYVRFVNEADVVPHIPPSHAHCGVKVQFTATGIKRSKPKRPVVGSTGDKTKNDVVIEADQDEAMSEEEFQELQVRLKAQNEVAPRLPDGTMKVGTTPHFIADHMMVLYLEKVRKLLGIAEPTTTHP